MTEPESNKTTDSSALTASQVAHQCFLDPTKLLFQRHGAIVRMTLEGKCSYCRVTVACAFPLSLPGYYWGILDGAQNEIGVIANPEGLSQESLGILRQELERRYIIPQITAINALRDQFGFQDWEVETDRGPRRFSTRDVRDNVLRPSPGRFLITDTDGTRYEIREMATLDWKSQDLLTQYI
jgi:hypothetical protein